ncbi:MAG: hypothetical protein P1V20_30335 [Verrucomicrobiales bacterium]|nr:hypothetical protein [Verrucomicrobiales bacterium]
MNTDTTIDNILEQRKARQTETGVAEDKAYSVVSAEGRHEHFLELQFRDGIKTCFAYNDLVFINFDPDEDLLDAEFGGFMVTLKGRGLGGKLFHHLKSKRVAWVKEADSEFEDNEAADIYISEIAITPPEGFGSEAE